MDLMRRTTRRLFTGLVAVLVAGGLAACQDAGAPLQPDGLQSTDADAAARGGGPPSHAGGNSSANCDVTVPDDELTIQGGVDAAAAGATVCVDGGSYTEQVVIDKDLTLRGLDGATIQGPADPAEFTIPESEGNIWEPIVFAYGGTVSGGDVSGAGTVDVNVRGLTIDGDDRPGSGPRYVGIFYRNANGTVEGNTVQNMGVGGRETFGILAYGDSHVTIAGNTVSGYERGGIGANGDGGGHPSPQVRIVSNDLEGSGDGSQTSWGPNGIQVGFGASGQIVGNELERNRWNDEFGSANTLASCILVFESDDVRVQRNEVRNCDVGVGVGAWGLFAATADNVKVTGNEVSSALIGVFLRAVAFPGNSADVSVSNLKVVRNVIEAGELGQIGIGLVPLDASVATDPVLDNNKIIRNTVTGFPTDQAIRDDGSATKAHANAFQP